MTNAAHLTSDQLQRYQDRSLAPAELLAVDRHIAKCSECRGVLSKRSGAEAQLSGLRTRFSEHLSYDQVVACAHAQGGQDVHGETTSRDHLEECAQCRAEVEDLRGFRVELESP